MCVHKRRSTQQLLVENFTAHTMFHCARPRLACAIKLHLCVLNMATDSSVRISLVFSIACLYLLCDSMAYYMLKYDVIIIILGL